MTTYDDVPYESHPYQKTHPDHLATMARLFGLNSPDVNRCRVLELGCAGGGNLIPMALAAPECTFLGVDLSERQLAEGWRLIELLHLTNIQLQHRSIMDIGADDGQFDYIICHGVFSWVSHDVQDKILDICRQNLAPSGVAYVSYNTYPGWFMRGMVRDMMRYHARQFDDAKTQVEQARALLDFLIHVSPAQDETYHILLRREAEILRSRQDSYLYHEHLEEDNAPLFFYQFIERAESKGLRYLSETQFSEMVPRNVSPNVETTLRELKVGLIHSEQYLDFLRNRTFRRTLLCHEEVSLNRQIGPEQLKGMYVSSPLKPTATAVNLAAHGDVEFRAAHGPTVTVSQPLVKAAVLRLGEVWPDVVPFDALPSLAYSALDTVLVRDAANYARDIEDLASLILELFSSDLAELHIRPPRCQAKAGDRPVASPLARIQAEANGGMVTNLRHDRTQLNDLDRRLLAKLDGAHDRQALAELLEKNVHDGELIIQNYDSSSDDDRTQWITTLLDHGLERLSRNALLMP